MSEFRTEVVGDEALRASLAGVASGLDNLTKAGQQAGQAVKVRAAQLAPVATGALSRSITASWTGTTVEVAARVPYAPYQEYGTTTTPASPYMRPALEATQSQIVDAYTGEIADLLETVKGA